MKNTTLTRQHEAIFVGIITTQTKFSLVQPLSFTFSAPTVFPIEW